MFVIVNFYPRDGGPGTVQAFLIKSDAEAQRLQLLKEHYGPCLSVQEVLDRYSDDGDYWCEIAETPLPLTEVYGVYTPYEGFSPYMYTTETEAQKELESKSRRGEYVGSMSVFESYV